MEAAPAIDTENRLTNRRPAFEAAVGLMVGITACRFLNTTGAVIIAVAAVIAGAAFLLFKRGAPGVLLTAASIGVLLALINCPKSFPAGNYTVGGIVADSYRSEDKTVLILKDPTLNSTPIGAKLMLTIGQENGCGIGDLVTAEAYARPTKHGDGEYDEFTTRLASRIGSVAYADSVHTVSRHNAPFAEFIFSIREAVEKRIADTFGEDADLFSALLLGNKRELDDERIAVFRASGTAHLLAISGFHMGITAGAAALLIPKRRRVLRLAVVSILMLAYCTVAAYAPGFVRAAVMMFFVLAANCLERRADMLNSLSIAAAAILLVNPYQFFSVGFRLSFAACFGIALFSGSCARFIKEHRLPEKLFGALTASACAVIGTIPIQLRCFRSFATYTLLANLVAIPAFSFVMISGALILIMAFILPGAAHFLAAVPRAVVFTAEKILGFISKLPFASSEFAPPSALCCAIWLVMLFVLSEYVLRPFKKRLIAASILLTAFTACYFVTALG